MQKYFPISGESIFEMQLLTTQKNIVVYIYVFVYHMRTNSDHEVIFRIKKGVISSKHID